MNLKDLLIEIFGKSDVYDFELVGENIPEKGFITAKYKFETPKVDTLPDEFENPEEVNPEIRFDSGTEYEVKMKPFRQFRGYTPWKDDWGEVPPIRVDFGPTGLSSSDTNEHRSIKVINTVLACIEDFINKHESVERLAIFAQVGFFEDVESGLESKRGKIYRYIVKNSPWVDSYDFRSSVSDKDYIYVELKR